MPLLLQRCLSFTGHPLGIVIKRSRKEIRKRDSSEPPMKKLAISAPKDEEIWDYNTSFVCLACSSAGQEITAQESKLDEMKSGIMTALSSAQQSEIKAWEEEIVPCEHTLTLQQEPVVVPGNVPSQCSSCDLTSNLWLCLTCGLANCGRQQFGGIGGNGHALKHFHETGHMLGVKLGTITPEGTADIYCYACDDAKVDPELATHLSTFGIEVMGQTKTEKSMTELQLEHNLKFDFSMVGDDGKELEPVFGKGLTGLRNLGNSCYMASVLQTLFALPAFRRRYTTPEAYNHFQTCPNPLPASCMECQMLKLGDGLLSGRYSHVARLPPPTTHLEEQEAPKFQEGIKPTQFKALIGKGHEEFSTMRQQDSEEFLQHLLTRLRDEAKRQGRNGATEPTEILKFAMEQRLQCGKCKRVGLQVEGVDLASLPVEAVEAGVSEDGKKLYEGVELESCLEQLCAEEPVAEYQCANCKEKTTAYKSTKFKTFPELLVLHMKKFQLVNWLPTKLDIPVSVPDILILDHLIAQGLQPGEEELEVSSSSPSLPEFNATAMAQLEAMGFPTVRCQKALLATGNSDAETAMGWLFEHMEDPDIDAPIELRGSKAASNEPSQEQIGMIADMGFSHNQARKALRESDGNPERAIEWLFSNPDDPGEDAAPAPAGSAEPLVGGSSSLPAKYRLKAFVSHKGPSVHSGHYVATIRQPQAGIEGEREAEEEWVLYNDEKVVRAASGGGEEMRGLAYLYVYERV
ncbi:Ubiquitin carboxyl-terminal hydrolase 14, putative [Cryptococcus gattii WM276]|uniref:Ubiquitin carboxyl-terminal hydrolase n=1 Tax=Cryptococcus gattii serotype B (strain WM276 / ATCC MYA-4071) TaxID=367775 RepID=E6R830_CRYGW|nr:Ubiquitin carboxyl-terminal hydrolase 14, putative [Cryptococcus gattii WM276]ADV23006.1 Ubiquitin carboxyl-terminal hydrolase 14, putative [Cryptococcus gattii WM276]